MTTLQAVTSEGANATLGDAELEGLRAALGDALVLPEDPRYEEARRIWNGNVDRRPALIVRCRGVADVRAAVNFAREQNLLVSVRGGGHSAAGYSTNDGGIVIDLSGMKGVRVDAAAQTARAEAGCTWAEFDRETQAFGLATTGGTVTNTGIAGLTLGGGLGWLMGKHGLTADGELRVVNETENPDLFWALRGGGENFGIVTSFEYRLHPVSMVFGGLVAHPLDAAPDVFRFYRDFAPTLPDEAEIHAGMLTSPEGVPICALLLGYNGDLAEAERVLAPAREFGTPAMEMVGPMPYAVRQAMLDEPNAIHGLQRYWRAAFTETLSDELIDAAVAAARDFTSPMSAIIFFYLHGAATRVAPDATAFAARRPLWDFNLIGQWDDPTESDTHIGWLKQHWAGLEPHLRGDTYINHIAADDAPEKIRASYGANYARLREIKARVDPTNLFRLNPNIEPG